MLREAIMMSIGVIFTAFLFLGGLILLHQVVTLNSVNPSSVAVVSSFIALGVFSGLIAATLITQGELKVLSKNGKFTLSNSAVIYAGAVGIPAFLLINFLFILLGRVFVVGEVFFLLAGLFAYFSLRLSLIIHWETKTKKFVMTQPGTFTTSGKLYIYPMQQIEAK